MELISNTTFDWDGQTYELRVMTGERGLTVAVFSNHRPASGVRYHVQVPSYADPRQMVAADAFAELLDHAREDIRRNRWNRMLGRE